MKEWFTAKELAEFKLPTLPSTERNVQLKSKRDCWKSRAREGRGGGKVLNHTNQESPEPPLSKEKLYEKTN